MAATVAAIHAYLALISHVLVPRIATTLSTNLPTRCPCPPPSALPNEPPPTSFRCASPCSARPCAQQCRVLTRELFCFRCRVPGPSKLAIPATASFQITINNLASVGSPLYGSLPLCPSFARSDDSYSPRSFLHFNRAGDASRPSNSAISVWELDGWWQPAAANAPGAGSTRTAIVIVACAVVVLAFFIYRYTRLLLFSAELAPTLRFQLLFRLFWSRTSRPTQVDDSPDGACAWCRRVAAQGV